MLRLGIISNPFAKMNKNHPEHNTQMWYTLANDGLYKITQSLEELDNVCREFRDRNVNLIGIVGGDGSVGLVLSYLYAAYKDESRLPKILLLKGGTINFLASNLGIHASALTCLNDTLFSIKQKQSLHEVNVRTIDVNGRIGFIFAGGMASSFLEEFYKNKTNSLGAIITAAKHVLDGISGGKIDGSFDKLFKFHSLKINTDPIPIWSQKPLPNNDESYSLFFASTLPSLPFNINLFKKITLKDQKAEFIAIAENKRNILKAIFYCILGKDITSFRSIDSVIFKRATIESESKLAYSLDGDLCVAEDGKIEIKYGPSFTFCSPYLIHKSEKLT